jgi:hypothetical protein
MYNIAPTGRRYQVRIFIPRLTLTFGMTMSVSGRRSAGVQQPVATDALHIYGQRWEEGGSPMTGNGSTFQEVAVSPFSFGREYLPPLVVVGVIDGGTGECRAH